VDQTSEKLAALNPAKRRWGDLGARAISGVVMIVVAIATARQGGTIFVAFWLAAAIAVHWEWQRLVGGDRPFVRLALGLVALATIAIYAPRDGGLDVGILVIATGAMAFLAGPDRRLWAAAGMLYAGLLVVAVLSLRFSFPFGSRSIIWLFATVWSTDVFAYFGGRSIGGPKLWPRISPSKTWSGTLVGVAAGTVIGTYAAMRDLPIPSSIAPVAIITLVAAVLSQGGDALESAIKRRFGVKDSSRLIPGHGGVMDRLDGFIAAAVFAFLVGLLRGLPSVAGGLFYWV
jgi:phosphatidate cytidylyltransferase